MHSVTACLPKRASMGHDVGLVVYTVGNIFLDARELAGRSLRSWLPGNLLQLVELALQFLDLGQQLTVLDLGFALDLVSEPGIALFIVTGCLESDDTFFDI